MQDGAFPSARRPDYERRRLHLKIALKRYRIRQMGAARRIQHSLRPILEEQQYKKRAAVSKIIQAMRERVQQQKAARTIQHMYRAKATVQFCDYVIAASITSGLDLEDVLSQAQMELEDMREESLLEDEWLLSSVMEDQAARKIQSILKQRYRRRKATDALCDAVLEQASQVGISYDDILSRASASDVLDDILSCVARSDELSGDGECEPGEGDDAVPVMLTAKELLTETGEQSHASSDSKDRVREFREYRAGVRIVEALQLYHQRLHAASVIQRHLRRRRPFRRVRAARVIVRGMVAFLYRRRRMRQQSEEGGA
eukprot:GEMP01046668.1.p1 GENE.GEMP01046668.1~~GEMP01046668.1.p1  ORF type:complete len:315 (+),score=83.27 GEMP01046668.1:81-1025(+)